VTNSGNTVNYAYDSAGSVTSDGVHSYGYDAENRLVSVDGGSTASYSYDHQNRRVKKVVGSSTTHYVWEGYQVIAEHNGSTGAVLSEYIFAGDWMIAREQAGRVFFLQDRLSVRATITDGQGGIQGRQAHLPFGEPFGTSGTQDKHRFTSYERDGESASDYAVNRQYSENIGRFNRPDPYGGSYTVGNPQSLNRYSYVENNAVNSMDPTGLDTRRYPGWMLCVVLPWLCDSSTLGEGNPPNPRTRGERGGGGWTSPFLPAPAVKCNIGIQTRGELPEGVPLTFPDGTRYTGPAFEEEWLFKVGIWASISRGSIADWTFGQTVTGTVSYSGFYTSTGNPFTLPRTSVDSSDPLFGGERFIEGQTKMQLPGHLWMFAIDVPGLRRRFLLGDNELTVTEADIDLTFQTFIRKGDRECGATWRYRLKITKKDGLEVYFVGQTGTFGNAWDR
jgi:RHS repeat-associated protein